MPREFDYIAEVHGHEAARRVVEEAHAQHADLGIDRQTLFAARLRHALAKETHVVVGDHAPEPRVNHDPCDTNDGSSVAECRGASCKRLNRCCWQ